MKLLLLSIILFCFISTQAQLRVGVQGGYNYARLSPNQTSSGVYSYSTSGLSGFQAGAVFEMKVSEYWIFRPSLLINGKGTRLEKAGMGITDSRFIQLHYVEIPISFVRSWTAGKDAFVFTGAGLYFARVVRGVEKGEGSSSSGSYSFHNSVEFSSDNKENDGHPTIINPFDYGFNLLAGVERRNIQLIMSYGQGLARVFPKSLVFEEKFTNRVLSLSAVYLFNTKK